MMRCSVNVVAGRAYLRQPATASLLLISLRLRYMYRVPVVLFISHNLLLGSSIAGDPDLSIQLSIRAETRYSILRGVRYCIYPGTMLANFLDATPSARH